MEPCGSKDPVEVQLSMALRALKGKPSSGEAMRGIALLAFEWGNKIQWYELIS